MKILRFGDAGHERPGVLDQDGRIRDVSQVVADIDSHVLAGDFARLREADLTALPLVPSDARLAPPIARVGKFVGIGLNFSDHAAESGMPVPREPVVFMKATSSISGPNDDIILPPDADTVDWEVELGIVIGREARYVGSEDALRHVAGVCVVNDVSERTYQLDRGGQWDKGKGCDTFGPIGPYLVTLDEAGALDNLDLWCDVNGVRMQSGNTRNMIFGPAFLVHYLSQFMSLQPGDVICTGTPAGVGLGRKPPQWLRPGDVVTLGVTELGEQRQTVRRYAAQSASPGSGPMER